MNEAKLYENEVEKKISEDYPNGNKYIHERILNDEYAMPYDQKLIENKNDKLLSQSESNNINNSATTNSQINNNLIVNEENGFGNIKQKNEKEKSFHYGNIGKNIVLCNKYVLGIKSSLALFIFTFLGMISTFLGWILTNNIFYPKIIYIIGGIPFTLTQIFFILCFLTEPGIIPRNDPEFSEKQDNLNKEKMSNILIDDSNNKESNIISNNIEKEEIQIKESVNIDNSNQNKNITLPKIFTERKCSTCSIIRPPCASHCRYCDNCILNLDHHCFFISNCVGQRNHKYFYLFLFFGSISAIIVSIFCFILIIYIFGINSKQLWKILFSHNKWTLLFCIILISFSAIYASLGCMNIFVLFGPSGVGFIIFCYLFYKNKPKDYESFRNPFCIPAIIASCYFGIFVTTNFFKQTRIIGYGLTIKQNSSIQKEIVDNSIKQKNVVFDKDYFAKKSIKEQFKNIKKFLSKKIDKSLIIPERDLFRRK